MIPANSKQTFFYALGISIVFGFFAVLVALIFKGGSETTVNILIGALTGAFLTVVGYFFGTNKSSEAKTEMIYNSTPPAPVPEPITIVASEQPITIITPPAPNNTTQITPS